jgi:hypothetical protein
MKRVAGDEWRGESGEWRVSRGLTPETQNLESLYIVRFQVSDLIRRREWRTC